MGKSTRLIERWKQCKEIYERHQAGERYAAIAEDLGVSLDSVKRSKGVWEHTLEIYEERFPLPASATRNHRIFVESRILPLIKHGLLPARKAASDTEWRGG